MSRVLIASVYLLALVLVLDAQNPPKPAPSSSASSGVINDGAYRNAAFGFSCKIPYGWVDRTQNMNEVSTDPAKSKVLLAVFERPPQAVGDSINSAIIITSESVANYSGLKEASDYFASISEIATAKGFKVVNDPYEFAVGAKPMVRGDFSKELGKLTMHQSSLVMLSKGYAVSFTFIAGSEDEIEQLLERLSFNQATNKH